MDWVFDRLLDAARQLLGLRAGLWLGAVALYGLVLGAALSHGAPAFSIDIMLFCGALIIGGAAFNMNAAQRRAATRQQQKLDALYGRSRGR